MTRWRAHVTPLGQLVRAALEHLWNVAACAYASHVWYRDGKTDDDGWGDTSWGPRGYYGYGVTRQSRLCARCRRMEHRRPPG